MPRNSSGVYTLPAGNPVTTRTIIESSWANNTMSDIANEITESLARNGAGGMTGPMKATDGTAAAPSITFGSETSTGLYRVASGQLGITTGGVQRFNISGSGSTFSVPVTVNNNVTVNAGATSTITINASSSPQLRLERSSSASNEKNWVIYADTASLQFRPYTDDYSSNTAALSIARSGATAGAVQTYGNLYVGINQSSVGYMGLLNGGGSSSGYTGFYAPNGVRVGFIGAATTYGTGDNGTLPYVAGTHAFTGNITATGTITGGSDARLKTDVKTIDGALAKVCAMRGVSFTRKDNGERNVGVIAQEVAEVVPEAVREDENGYLSVAYGNMVGVLIEAVKELRDEVWQLKLKCCH
jgi:uncharacterized protein YaiE (UPF0345 family)